MLREPSSTGLAHPQEGVAPLSAALASFSLCCVTPRPFTRWIHRDWRNWTSLGARGVTRTACHAHIVPFCWLTKKKTKKRDCVHKLEWSSCKLEEQLLFFFVLSLRYVYRAIHRKCHADRRRGFTLTDWLFKRNPRQATPTIQSVANLHAVKAL